MSSNPESDSTEETIQPSDTTKAAPSAETQSEPQNSKTEGSEFGTHGMPTDPTPNEHYSVSGVTAGKPTPETDLAHAEAVRKAVTTPPEKPTPDTGNGLQAAADNETEQGFRGIGVDPTDNKAYTVAGVTSGMPTPETDAEAAKTARDSTGTGLSPLESAARDREVTTKG